MALNMPNPSRFYSLALGKLNNFKARTDGLIAEADSSPDVSLTSLLYSNNSSTLVIQDFDGGSEGQIIHLINVGSNVSFLRGSLLVIDSSNLQTNDSITFVKHLTSWYELTRSACGNLAVKFAAQLAADNAYVDVTNANVLVISNSGATILTGLSGGYIGQILTIVCNGSSVTLSNNTCVINQGSGGVGYVMPSNGAVQVVRLASKWLTLREAITGANA